MHKSNLPKVDPREMIAEVEEIAKHTPDDARRVRYLIREHDFPAVKRGGRFYSHPDWIAAYYSNWSHK